MNEAEVHVEDVNTELVDVIKDESGTIINLSTASTKKISFQLPDNTTAGPFDASFDTDGVDGALKYASLATTFTIAGVYKYQFYAVVGSSKFYGHVQTLTVQPNVLEVE